MGKACYFYVIMNKMLTCGEHVAKVGIRQREQSGFSCCKQLPTHVDDNSFPTKEKINEIKNSKNKNQPQLITFLFHPFVCQFKISLHLINSAVDRVAKRDYFFSNLSVL